MSKICVECGCEVIPSDIQGLYYCPHCEDNLNTTDDVRDYTLFDRITASPEVLAEKLVYCSLEEYYKPFSSNKCGMGLVIREEWRSTITGGTYRSKAEALAATVEKLKEVAE
jgi:hypothetical protein